MSLKNCVICKEDFEESKKRKANIICTKHSCYASYKKQKRFDGKILGIDYIECPVCSRKMGEFTSGHTIPHGYATPRLMCEAFGLEHSKCQSKREKMSGENNPGYQHGGKLSPWSNKSLVHSAEEVIESKRKAYENMQGDNKRPNQENYWIEKGYSAVEAKELVRNRQITFNLDICIEKYGEVEGRKRWADRQESWMTSLHKNQMYKGYSSISQSLFERLAVVYPSLMFGKNEKQIRCEDRVYKVDCFHPETNKVIEFLGDYWHGNPEKFEASDEIKSRNKNGEKIKVSEQWQLDDIREKALNLKGHETKFVWEDDYRKNNDIVVKDCLEFLKN